LEKKKFNQADYLKEWSKENMRNVIGSYKKEFVFRFRDACKKLGVTQSEIIRNAMIATIEQAEENRK